MGQIKRPRGQPWPEGHPLGSPVLKVLMMSSVYREDSLEPVSLWIGVVLNSLGNQLTNVCRSNICVFIS